MSAIAELDYTAPEPIILQIAQDATDFDVQSHQGYGLGGWNNYLIISELNPRIWKNLRISFVTGPSNWRVRHTFL